MSGFTEGERVFVSYYSERLNRRDEEELVVKEVRPDSYLLEDTYGAGDELYRYDVSGDTLVRLFSGNEKKLGVDVSMASA